MTGKWIRFFLFLYISLLLTACSNNHTPAPVVELYQGKSYKDFDKGGFQQARYQVKKGDTLYSVAWHSGKDYRELARINNISAPFNIYPGQVLHLHASESRSVKKPTRSSGLTSKKRTKQPVDHSKKQAYGGSQAVKKTSAGQPPTSFPARVREWVWPATGAVISRFSLQEQGNKGIDIAGPLGKEIRAAAAGKVVYTGNALRGYGQLVIIKHTDSFLSAYAHNDKIRVKEQQWIDAGQVIASMGNSGTDRVKLHFEVRYKGKSVDPLRYLPKK